MKAIEQYFPEMLGALGGGGVIMLYKVVPTSESVDEILLYGNQM